MKLKFQLNEKISKFEALLSQKEKYDENATGKEIIEKKRIEEKLDDIESEFQKDIKNLEQELKAQKKKSNKFYDIEQKEKMINLLKEKINILEKKYKGEDVDESEVKNNESMIQSLDDFLKNSKINENPEQRELFEEEKNKIEEYDRRRREQDEQLDEIHKEIKQIKNEAINAGNAINEIGKKIKINERHIDDTTKKVKTQNERVKEIVNKIRSSDKICCDIVLILILCGLICVLYSIIKRKF
jgi:chromosome segregation ATPase